MNTSKTKNEYGNLFQAETFTILKALEAADGLVTSEPEVCEALESVASMVTSDTESDMILLDNKAVITSRLVGDTNTNTL